jgi:serine/threonine protein kinase
MKDPADRFDGLHAQLSESSLTQDELVELLRADQRRRWHAGQPLPVALYLERFPQLHAGSTAALDLIWSEYLIRESLGNQPSLEEYIRDFPQYSSLLQQQHRVHEWVEHASSPLSALPTLAGQSVNETPGGRSDAGSQGERRLDLLFPNAQGYEILEEIGRGGMGVVYKALDRRREQVVALKVMHGTDPSTLYRFKKEFRGLADLSHPNLVTLRELVSDGRNWFFTMDLIDGVDFLAFVRPGDHSSRIQPTTELQITGLEQGKRLLASEILVVQGSARFDRLRDCMWQLAKGVSALHEAGWLHRDLKPSNVLVTRDGRAVILDFGLGAELGPGGLHHRSSTHLLGTAAYMSPEQAAGHSVTPASDWYSVGVMLYEALTGRLPFVGSAVEVLMAKQSHDPTSPVKLQPGLPEDLDTLCSALLCRDPSARPRAVDVLSFLQSCTPRPRASSSQPSSIAASRRLVGREKHLRDLVEAYRETRHRGPTLVLVHGPSGVGKTALVEYFLDSLPPTDGAVVLTGRCHVQESVPYKALDGVIDALAHALGRMTPGEVEAVLPRDFPYLCQAFPTLRLVEGKGVHHRRLQEIADLRELRKRSVAALRDLLGRLSDRRPLVLWIDDLHWGDQDSASLLVDLLEPPDPPTLLLIGCYRRADAENSPFLERLLKTLRSASEGVVVRDLPVDELEAEEALALALDLYGDEYSDPEREVHAAAAARESAGNPFFIGELVRNAGHDCDAGNSGSAWQPIRLVDVVEKRLRSLSVEARRVLEIIAVFGRPLGGVEACRAAGELENGPSLLAALRSARLIRTTSFRGTQDQYESYHDRIRETVHSLLDPSALEAHHLCLAMTLKAMSYPDPEVLAIHFREAGWHPEASRYFALAGDQSVAVLAFDRASSLYRLAIDLGSASSGGSRELRVKLAEALANAGRGGEAGGQFLAGAVDDSLDSLDLRRRASYQYLISGHVDQGLATLRDVMGALGMRIPRSSWEIVWSLVGERTRARVAGISRRLGAPAIASRRDLTEIDVCWCASIGLSIIDPIRGSVFQARGLRHALRAGEPKRLVRALAMEAAHVACAGRPVSRRTARLLQVAESAGSLAPEPYTRGMLQLARAIVAYLECRWSDARAAAEPAEAIFRDHCTGVAWEIDTARIFALWSLNFLGKITELRQRWSNLIKDARERGNIYMSGTLGALLMAVVRLADDDLEGGQAELAEVARLWSHQGYHIQHHNRTLARCLFSLYRSENTETWDLLESLRSTYARSLLLRVQTIRIELERFRARGAIAASCVVHDSGRLLREAEKAALSLDRERVPVATAHALSIRAQIAATAGAVAQARVLFERAIRAFEELGMSLFAAAARRRLGRLVGGDEGNTLVTGADEWMKSQGIRNPPRMAALYIAPDRPFT